MTIRELILPKLNVIIAETLGLPFQGDNKHVFICLRINCITWKHVALTVTRKLNMRRNVYANMEQSEGHCYILFGSIFISASEARLQI